MQNLIPYVVTVFIACWQPAPIKAAPHTGGSDIVPGPVCELTQGTNANPSVPAYADVYEVDLGKTLTVKPLGHPKMGNAAGGFTTYGGFGPATPPNPGIVPTPSVMTR